MPAPANRLGNRFPHRRLVKAITGIQGAGYYAAMKKGGVDQCVRIESNVQETGKKPTVEQYVQSDLREKKQTGREICQSQVQDQGVPEGGEELTGTRHPSRPACRDMKKLQKERQSINSDFI